MHAPLSFKPVEREHLFRGISLMTSQKKRTHLNGYKICYKCRRFQLDLHGMHRYHLECHQIMLFSTQNGFFSFPLELSQLSCNRCTSIIIITVVIVQFLRLNACRTFFLSAFFLRHHFHALNFPIHGAYQF